MESSDLSNDFGIGSEVEGETMIIWLQHMDSLPEFCRDC